MEKSRRHYSPQQKVAILREHLIEQVSLGALREASHTSSLLPPYCFEYARDAVGDQHSRTS